VKRISFLFFLFVSIQLNAQTGNSFYVKVKVEKEPIKVIFSQIEMQLGFKFSYNTRLINADSIVTYSCNGTLKKVISELFEKRIQAKPMGDYIVLVRSKKAERKLEKNNPSTVVFKGQVLDKRTKTPVQDVSIYEITSRVNVLSDSLGYFEITIVSGTEKNFTIAKSGFKDVILPVNVRTENNVEILLIPLSTNIGVITKSNTNIKIKEEPTIVPKLVPHWGLIIADNLQNVREKRIGQVSFVPLLGTNLGASGVIDNRFSLNIIGGYNGGVEGVEIGGVFNIIKTNVWGMQAAGLTNIVTGKVQGFQIAGISNIIGGKITGMQVGGIFNHNKSKFIGLQVSGITNLQKDTLVGMQVAGIYNRNDKNVTGLQVAGIRNTTFGKMNGVQIALINYAYQNNGLQLGLINVSDTARGTAIGLFNYVKNGYHPIEAFSNEVLDVNLAFKTGMDYFYTTYTAGLRYSEPHVFGVGMGFGTKINTWKWLSISLDLSANFINELEDTEVYNPALNLLNRFDLTLDFTLGKFSLIAGPAVNFHISQLGYSESGTFITNIAVDPFYTEKIDQTQYQSWFGGKLGLRFSF
jgi:hypothetical protein